MAYSKIKNDIIEFYNDPTYQELNSYYNKTTIFNILKVERSENRHSAFIAWLLNANESHNLGKISLKKFLRLITVKEDIVPEKFQNDFLIGNYDIDSVSVETEKQVAKIDNKSGRIDIFVTFDIIFKNTTKYKVFIILENKIYTSEHDNQTDRYLKWVQDESADIQNKLIIPIFLTPYDYVGKCTADNDIVKYIKISYQELLTYVIEPLTLTDLSKEIRFIIEDYIVNLGQPKSSFENLIKNNETGMETILAVSQKNQLLFQELYERFYNLINASMMAFNSTAYNYDVKKFKDIFGDNINSIYAYMEENKDLLSSFWDTNKMILRMITYYAYKTTIVEDDDNASLKSIEKILQIKDTNRDSTKYIVSYIDKAGKEVFINSKPAPKSVTSFYIFKAWTLLNPDATIADIRKAFSIEECAKHYIDTFQFMFYRWKNAKEIVDYSDETNPKLKGARKYTEWDFFSGKNADKYHLSLKDAPKVMSIKMWHKNEFDILIRYAYEKYNIIVKSI